MNSVHHQGVQPVGRLLLKYSLPAIMGFMASALYQFVDRILVGRGVGTEAMAAVTCAYPLTILGMGLGLLLGTGTGNQISTFLGKGLREEAERVLGQSLRLAMLLGSGFALVQIVFAKPLLIACGANGAVLDMAIPYLQITAVSQICVIAIISMGSILRVQGRPGLGLAFMGVGNVLNAGLAALAIFVLHWGIIGAALATLLTTILNTAALIFFVQSRHSVLHIHKRHLAKDTGLMASILKLGAPVFLMQVFGMLTFLVANQGAAGLDGVRGVAAVGIFNTISILLIYGPLGVAQALQPLVAFNRGAGRPDRVRALLGRALITTTTMGVVSALAVACFPELVAGLFTRNDVRLVEIVRDGLPFFMLSVALFGVQGTTSHYFLATHQPKQASLLLLGRQILAIPLFLILPKLWGFSGLYLVSACSDIPMAILATYLLRKEWHRLGKECSGNQGTEEQQKEIPAEIPADAASATADS